MKYSIDSNEKILLCLLWWTDHDHPSLQSPELGLVGHRLLLYYRIDDIDASWERALTLKTTVNAIPIIRLQIIKNLH